MNARGVSFGRMLRLGKHVKASLVLAYITEYNLFMMTDTKIQMHKYQAKNARHLSTAS